MGEEDFSLNFDESDDGVFQLDDLADEPVMSSRQVDPIEDQKTFVTKLLHGNTEQQDIDELIRRNFSVDAFDPVIRPKLSYMMEHFRNHRVLPRASALLKNFPTFAQDCLLPPDAQPVIVNSKIPLHALYQEVFDGSLLIRLKAGINILADAWEDGNKTINQIWEIYESNYRELARLRSLETRQAKTLSEAIEAVRDMYHNAQNELTWGIPMPFPFLYDSMRGLQPAELTTVVGKAGVGKTWFALMCAVAALVGDPYFLTPPDKVGITRPTNWKEVAMQNRRRVLIVSLEMPILQIARRLVALLTKLPYPQIRAGKFKVASHEQVFFDKLDMIKNPHYAYGDNCLITTAATMDQVASDAESFKADLVIIDGFYLMAGQGEKRWERVQENTRGARVHALTSLMHYTLISQMDAKEDRVAFSQSIEQDSSNVIVLAQSPGERNSKQMRISSRKIRDGQAGDEFLYSWDIEQNRFIQESRIESSSFNHDT